MREPIAKEYLSLTDKWEETNHMVIASNVNKYMIAKYPECKVRSVMHKKLSEFTGSSTHATYAWMNKSREDVKVPIIKLCMIAEALNIDIQLFLTEEEE